MKNQALSGPQDAGPGADTLVVPRAARLAGILWLAAWACACASTGARPRPFPTPPEPAAATPAAADVPGSLTGGLEDAPALVRTALRLAGVPYRDGGADPTGFDCSGFTQYVFARHQIALPREVRDQFAVGDPVAPGAIEPGDLLFFTTVAPGASHVGIAVDADRFVHAPSSRGVVRIERLSAPYWASRFVGARRIRAARSAR